MFHLVVLQGSATKIKATCDEGRFLEYTETASQERFADIEGADFSAIPALFMGEGYNDEVVKIGTILKGPIYLTSQNILDANHSFG